MKVSDMYPSSFLKAEDLQGKKVRLTVAGVAMEKLGDDTKPVMAFRGTDKKFVLNRTNASMMQELFGDESSDWVGKPIMLYPTKTNYQGKMVPCLRIEEAPALKAKEPEPPPELREPGDDSEMPF